VAHIDHAVNVCGEDVVGIGTDGTVTSIDDLQGYRTVLAKEMEERRKAGVSAAGSWGRTFYAMPGKSGEPSGAPFVTAIELVAGRSD
jgi:microsomal dipeptidase-like Zn-dependent dipeptidase